MGPPPFLPLLKGGDARGGSKGEWKGDLRKGENEVIQKGIHWEVEEKGVEDIGKKEFSREREKEIISQKINRGSLWRK